MSVAAVDVIAIAKAEKGYHEGRSNGHWNNHQKYSPAVPGLEWSQDQAWCATFVSWCAMKAGASDIYPRTASCLTAVSWFRQRGRFSEYPAIGAQVFYGPGGGSHTGIVYDFDGTYVYTVEGNTNADGSAEGDGVYLKTRRRRDAYVYGYGYPKFTGGIVSADPRFRDDVPAISLAAVVYCATHNADDERKHPAYADSVDRLQAALESEGLLKRGGYVKRILDPATRDAYAAYQRRLGYRGGDADGVPGSASLAKLAAAHGFRAAT
ncbi:CHAP domain-containing protein [Streptomyces varsoviensis]|uniref:CHAP domain-containing protein n=1 Tax=Streptomyces varsoviensis TaxID=67373 RepID=UPI0033F2FB9C